MDVRHVNPVRSSGSATELSVTDGPDLGGAAMHHVYAQSEAESVFVCLDAVEKLTTQLRARFFRYR
jgi:hypothetical protein